MSPMPRAGPGGTGCRLVLVVPFVLHGSVSSSIIAKDDTTRVLIRRRPAKEDIGVETEPSGSQTSDSLEILEEKENRRKRSLEDSRA